MRTFAGLLRPSTAASFAVCRIGWSRRICGKSVRRSPRTSADGAACGDRRTAHSTRWFTGGLSRTGDWRHVGAADVLGRGVDQDCVDDAGAVEPATPATRRLTVEGFEPSHFLHPAHVQLEALRGERSRARTWHHERNARRSESEGTRDQPLKPGQERRH